MHCLPPAHIVRASLEPPRRKRPPIKNDGKYASSFPANPAAKSVFGRIARLTRDEMSRALLRQAQILKTHATRYSGSPQTFSRPSDLSLSSRIGFELFEYRPRASMQPSFLLTSCDSKVSGTQALTRTINVAWPIGTAMWQSQRTWKRFSQRRSKHSAGWTFWSTTPASIIFCLSRRSRKRTFTALQHQCAGPAACGKGGGKPLR
jgi:hypothetical protein